MVIGLRYLIFLLLISSFPANSKWEDGIPMPQAKSGTVATVIDNNIILIGGKSIVEGSPVSEIFDIKGNIWRPISIMPKKLIGTRIVNIGDKGLVCGGFNNQKITNECWVYDVLLSLWVRTDSMPLARAEHSMIRINNKIYVLGGVGEEPERLMIYNISKKRWSISKYNLPTVRYSMATTKFNDSIVTVGGVQVSSNNVTSVVEVFDPEKNKWTRLKDLPQKIASASATEINSKLHVVGGKTFSPLKTYDTHYIYFNNDWSEREPMPTPRHDMASVNNGKKWYIIGGAVSPGIFSIFSPTDVVEIYSQ